MCSTIYIAIGANLGDRHAQCRQAITLLHGPPMMTITAVSSLHEYSAVTKIPGERQPAYLNGVAAATTTLPPDAVLAALEQIERDMGRIGKSDWAPRPIDLDLLLYGTQVIHSPHLTIPHPHLHQRRFVLEPLCALAPDLVHPVLGTSMRQLLEALP